MSSDESNSSSPAQSPSSKQMPRNSVALLLVSLVLLAGLVWAMAPRRAKFQPAPLRAAPEDCPKTTPGFVPSDATEVTGVDLSALSQVQRNRVLYRLNMEPCPCGCNISIAACRINHPACPLCKDLAPKIVAEERQRSEDISR